MAILMLLNEECVLLVDTNTEFTRTFAEFYFGEHTAHKTNLVVAGDNTRAHVKMMFQDLIKDYCFCDISNEISVSELASYIHEHHPVSAVIINALDYHLANEEQKFIFDSLHPIRYLAEENDKGEFYFERVDNQCHDNHLSCNSKVAEATEDITQSLYRLDSEKQI
ncbi:hypothetical protein PALB_7770 [Pseudoalteromonas luteoviolacea B = ATCC 29581]|nr:hypothetical protein PALB_7770 [Pseudoalteromonas luteoviolacea B = ATCC 29581]